MRRMIPAVLALSVLVFGCKVKELADKANIAKDLDKRGTVDLMKQVADDKYDPPKDGKLTESQVQMYKKMLDGYEKTAKESKQAAEGVDPAVAYNRQLLKKYDTELAAFTSELSKYEAKEGDAKKSMDELQQKMNQATEDAKKNAQ